jgi:hypothetical protein
LTLCAGGTAALGASALPRVWMALPLALLLSSLWRQHQLPRGVLVLHPAGEAEWWARVPNGPGEPCPVDVVELQVRGAVAVLGLRIDGRLIRWPLASDTLPGPQSRALRLWFERHRPRAHAPPSTPTH